MDFYFLVLLENKLSALVKGLYFYIFIMAQSPNLELLNLDGVKGDGAIAGGRTIPRYVCVTSICN